MVKEQKEFHYRGEVELAFGSNIIFKADLIEVVFKKTGLKTIRRFQKLNSRIKKYKQKSWSTYLKGKIVHDHDSRIERQDRLPIYNSFNGLTRHRTRCGTLPTRMMFCGVVLLHQYRTNYAPLFVQFRNSLPTLSKPF